MENYVIEKNVALPMSFVSGGFPFAKMEVGDSFTVPLGDRLTLVGKSHYFAKKNGVKFKIRKFDTYCRIWRIT